MGSALEYNIKIIGELPDVIDRIPLLKVRELYLLRDIVEQLEVVGKLEKEGLLLEEKHELIDDLEGPYLEIGDLLQGIDEKVVVDGLLTNRG